MSKEKVVETFDRWADEGRDAGMEDGHGDVVRQVIEKIGIGAGERVLDLGCGNGWATRLIARSNAGVQAIGVDASPKMIARADELHSFTIRARYDWGSFENLEFKDENFDRIFSMEALYYAHDLEKALAESFRVLKPGGKADILVDYYEESTASHPWAEIMDLALHRLDESGWRAAFEAAGFTGVSTRRVIDSRADAVEDDECSPDDDSKRQLREAGTLWIHAEKA